MPNVCVSWRAAGVDRDRLSAVAYGCVLRQGQPPTATNYQCLLSLLWLLLLYKSALLLARSLKNFTRFFLLARQHTCNTQQRSGSVTGHQPLTACSALQPMLLFLLLLLILLATCNSQVVHVWYNMNWVGFTAACCCCCCS